MGNGNSGESSALKNSPLGWHGFKGNDKWQLPTLVAESTEYNRLCIFLLKT
jgi:hypothetical protein